MELITLNMNSEYQTYETDVSISKNKKNNDVHILVLQNTQS